MFNFLVFLVVVGVAYISFRLKRASKQNLDFWGNPSLYLFILSIPYLIQPCYLYYEDIFRLIEFDDDIMGDVYRWSIYYFGIFFIFYIFSSDRKFEFRVKEIHLSDATESYIKIILLLTSFSLSLIVLYATSGVDADASRPDKYITYLEAQKISGFTFLSWFVIAWSFVMAVRRKNIFYLFYLAPLIYLELIFSSRYYIFVLIIAVILYRSIVCELGIKIFYIFIPIALFFFIGILREGFSGEESVLSLYLLANGEFINTWNSIGLVFNNNFKFDVSPLFVFVQRLIPEPLSGLVFGPKLNYADNIQGLHSFEFGLGSSVVTEGLAYGVGVTFLLPIIIGLVYMVLGNYVNKNTIGAKLVQFFLIVNVFSIFRGSAIINSASFVMIYFFIFFVPNFIMKDFYIKK